MNIQDTINTDRLLIQTITEADHEFIRQLVNTQGWLQFIGDRHVYSKEEALAYIRKINTTQDLRYWVVRLKEDTPIGLISFLKRNYLQHFDIGFAFLPAYCGQGYAYEAANAVLQIVKQLPEYATILATTVPGNVNSVKLLKKLGLIFEREIEVENHKLQVYPTG